MSLLKRIFWYEKKDTVGARMTREDYRVAISGEGGAAPATPSHSENIRITKAYERACANRDFEIKLFWQRSLFFWGFVSVCFVGYFQISTSKDGYPHELKLYCILLGLLFSVAWLLIIKASKHWQENWEAHIDALEEYVTAPIFQIVNYSVPGNSSNPRSVHSVSKITEVMAYVVIVAWTGLLSHYVLPKVISLVQLKAWIKSCCNSIPWNHMPEIIAFVAFVPFLWILLGGYPLKRKTIVASDERRAENFPNFHRTLPNRWE
jgi:hypothetical protein